MEVMVRIILPTFGIPSFVISPLEIDTAHRDMICIFLDYKLNYNKYLTSFCNT